MSSEALLDPERLSLWSNELTQNRVAPSWFSTTVTFAGENPITWFSVRLL
jgi:hypothetical protein